MEPLAKLFLKISPGFTWGYSNSTPIGVVPGFTWVKARGEWGYSFNNINPVGVEREEQEVKPGVLQEPQWLMVNG